MGVLPVEGGVAALHPEVPAGVGGHLHLVHWRGVSRGLLLLCYCLAVLAVPTLYSHWHSCCFQRLRRFDSE